MKCIVGIRVSFEEGAVFGDMGVARWVTPV